MSLDKDDKLGELSREYPLWTTPGGASAQQWSFSRSDWTGYSSWNYTVTYQVIIG